MRVLVPLVASVALSALTCFHAERAEAGVPTSAKYRYHYISLDQAELPGGFAFFSPAEVVDSGKVYGTLLRSDDPDGCFPAVGVWQDGRVRRLVDGGTRRPPTASGTIGGTVVRDCAGKVALFRRGGVKLIPTPPSALFSFVAPTYRLRAWSCYRIVGQRLGFAV